MLQGFEHDEDMDLKAFLREHSYLQPVLVELEEVLPDYFPDSTFYLSIRCEDGVDTGQGSLIVTVQGQADLSTMHERRKAFNREWWRDHYDETQNKLFINIDHQELTEDGP